MIIGKGAYRKSQEEALGYAAGATTASRSGISSVRNTTVR